MTYTEFEDKLNTSQAWQALRPKTQKAYLRWMRRYIAFLQAHPDIQESKLRAFLLEACSGLSAGTTWQATCAIRWMYRHLLHEEIRPVRIKKAYRLPDIMTKQDVAWELSRMPMPYSLMGWVFFGSGLTLAEARDLRHEQIRGRVLSLDERTIPLCRQAQALYVAGRPTDHVFPLSSTAFLATCRRYDIDRRITPSMLRANFILRAIEAHGVAWTQQVSGLSRMRIKQYLAMVPACRHGP